MSMLMLPDKKICYLLPLSRELPSPKRLENDLDHAEVRTRKLLYEHPLLHILESVGLFCYGPFNENPVILIGNGSLKGKR